MSTCVLREKEWERRSFVESSPHDYRAHCATPERIFFFPVPGVDQGYAARDISVLNMSSFGAGRALGSAD